ncbi:MAG: cardiolipin synthase [Clostridia bacterium]|nr:cardiolipin synthase [Clostridia bacterium]
MDRKKEKLRRTAAQDQDDGLLLQKGKRGILNLVFGRTMLVILMLLAQILLLAALLSRLQNLMPYYYGFTLVLYAAMILHLVNKNSEPYSKIVWILLVVLAPALGLALYAFVESELGHRVLNRRLGELMKETAAFLPEEMPMPEGAEATEELEGLAEYAWAHGGYPLYRNTAVEYLDSGEDSMEAMLRDLEGAKDFIFMEFFIIDEGYLWGRVLKILEEKVRQGVDVRVMYDGTCAIFRLPYRYPELLKERGIQCKMFSPIRPMLSTHYNNRDHRKILVVDGRVAYTGGVNLADEYINRGSRFGHWKDVSVRLAGEAVRSFTLMFLQMWNVNEADEAFARYLDVPPSEEGAGAPGYVLPYGDSPLDQEQVGELVYMDILARATRYVHIMTPYLILDREMTTALTFAAKRGVEVCILLPHIPDKKYAFALAKTHYRVLLEAGVRILEYTPGFVHAKTFVSDDCKAVVGTINLDYRSFYLHFECATYLRDMPAVQAVERDFQATAAKCQEIHLQDLKDIPLTTRAVGWLLKVFAPVM